MLRKIDEVLFDAAQNFCDVIQYRVGLTKFTLQQWAAIVQVVCFGVSCLILLRLTFPRVGVVLIIALFVIQAIEAAWFISGNMQEKAAFFTLKELKPSPYPWNRRVRMVMISALIGFPALLSQDAYFLWLFLSSIWWVVRAYFSACIPQSPSKSQLRMWLERSHVLGSKPPRD